MNIFKTKILWLFAILELTVSISIMLQNHLNAMNALMNCPVGEGTSKPHLNYIIIEKMKVFMITIKFYTVLIIQVYA